MNYNFDRISFDNLFTNIEKAGMWLNEIGIQTANTRFDDILQVNREIVEYYNKNLVDELIDKHDNLKLWYALTEASTFINIYNAFKDEKSHILPRSKLKMMLNGPYHTWDESVHEGNIDPRNILFELESGAIFKNVGVKITGFDDIDFVFKKTKFNVQCKRLHSEKKVEDNISDAIKQFRMKMKSKQNVKGILCLNIDKLTSKERMILNVKSPGAIQPKLSHIATIFLNKYRRLWQNQPNTNLLAVLIFCHAVAIIKDQPGQLLTQCLEIEFDIIPSRTFLQWMDYDLILELGQRVQGSLR